MLGENRRGKIIAELYDKHSSEFYDCHAKRGDVKFYIGFAVESGGPVLELECGTGRILIPTARAGVQVTGLDKSNEMLDICRKKIECKSSEVRSRVKVVHSDMCAFDLDSEFSLAMIPYGPFNSLLSVGEQVSCRNCINRHLHHNGALLFDLCYPDLRGFKVGEEMADVVLMNTPFEMPSI